MSFPEAKQQEILITQNEIPYSLGMTAIGLFTYKLT